MNIQGYYGAYAGFNLSGQMQQQQLAAEQAAQARTQTAKDNGQAAETSEKASSKPQDIWKELGSQFDVSEMTLQSMQKVSFALYSNNKITVHEHSVMTFTRKEDSNEDMEGMFLTSADEEGKRNWIEEFKARLEQHQAENDEQAAAMDKRILGILERLQAAAAGGLNLKI